MVEEAAQSELISRMELYFKRIDRERGDEDDYEDDTIFGDFWEPLESKLLEEWSIGLVPMTENVHLVHMFKNSPDFICLLADEKIKDVEYTNGRVQISCKVTTEPYYIFTICLDYSKSKFNLLYFLRTLQNSNYKNLLKNIEEQIDNGIWGTGDKRLGVRAVVTRLREILLNLAMGPTALLNEGKRLISLDATLHRLRRVVESQGSSSHSVARPITPTSSQRTTKELEATSPPSLDACEVNDFTLAKQMFESFWRVYSDCFVFNFNEKKLVNINQLELAPSEYIIRRLDPKGVTLMAHYLSHMPGLSTRQTICIMPKDVAAKPTSWDEVKDGQFWIINGQYNVEAAKLLQDSGLPEDRMNELCTWNALIVWSEDAKSLQRISKFCNRCNHCDMFQPTWGTNVIGARHIWTKLGRPTPPKEATAVEVVVERSKHKNNVKNEENWKEFYEAVQLRFASIDVNTTKKAKAKTLTTTTAPQKVDEKLNICNEIKIITSDDTTFELWSKVIFSYFSGGLIDSDTVKKFKDIWGWKAKKDRQSNRKFFKWMSNCGKRKIVEILDSDNEAHNKQSPQDAHPEGSKSLGNESEFDSVDSSNTENDETRSQNLLRLIPVDDDTKFKGEFRVLQRQRAEMTSKGLNFFSLDVDVHKQRRRHHKSLMRQGNVILEGNLSGSVFPHEPAPLKRPFDQIGFQNAALAIGRLESKEFPFGNDPKMMFMMHIFAKQAEQMQQMQVNMLREMQRENRKFQKEIREESHKLVVDLIARTVTQLNLAYNIQPLMTIGGAPPSDKLLPVGTLHGSRPSPTLDASLPSVKVPSVSGGPDSLAWQPLLLEVASDMQGIPTALLPAPGDQIIQGSSFVRGAVTVDIPDSHAGLMDTTNDEIDTTKELELL